jgi:hypothetical protein
MLLETSRWRRASKSTHETLHTFELVSNNRLRAGLPSQEVPRPQRSPEVLDLHGEQARLGFERIRVSPLDRLPDGGVWTFVIFPPCARFGGVQLRTSAPAPAAFRRGKANLLSASLERCRSASKNMNTLEDRTTEVPADIDVGLQCSSF